MATNLTLATPGENAPSIGGADLGFGEGAYYVQLHASCGIAAVNYQQS